MPGRKETRMTEQIVLRVQPDLIKAADKAADAEELTRNQFWARVVAGHLGKPELGRIPRRHPGRKRNELANA